MVNTYSDLAAGSACWRCLSSGTVVARLGLVKACESVRGCEEVDVVEWAETSRRSSTMDVGVGRMEDVGENRVEKFALNN
nr:hypothetical protein CFP56_77242 [Quercus suber]